MIINYWGYVLQILDQVMGNPSNRVCADCSAEGRAFLEGEGHSKGTGVLSGGPTE